MDKISNKSKVLSLGALAMDIVLETSVLPEADGFSLISNEKVVPGGSAANMSVALSKMGAKVWQTGKIGADHYGKIFKNDLIRQGIYTNYLVEKSGGVTLHTYIITTPEGDHCIFANKGDCVFELLSDELPSDCIEGFDCFYNDLFSADAAIYLAEEACKRGIPVVYNVQCSPGFMEICGVGIEKIEKMLFMSDMVVGNIESLKELCHSDSGEYIARYVYQNFGVKDGVICTMGSKGAFYCGREGAFYTPAFPVEVRDTTGAGDAFCAGVIFERYCSNCQDMKYVMEFATAVAALKCETKGPRLEAGLEDVVELMKRR